jgi:hypothetical protein
MYERKHLVGHTAAVLTLALLCFPTLGQQDGGQFTVSAQQHGNLDLYPGVRAVAKPNPRLGSWGGTVKNAATGERDDYQGTVDALLGTGQNFHIYPINSPVEWEDFQALLEREGDVRRAVQYLKDGVDGVDDPFDLLPGGTVEPSVS